MGVVDRGEPVRLWEQSPYREVCRWVTSPWDVDQRQSVAVGELPDGRWYVSHTGRHVVAQTRAYATREVAERIADQVMAAAGVQWRHGASDLVRPQD